MVIKALSVQKPTKEQPRLAVARVESWRWGRRLSRKNGLNFALASKSSLALDIRLTSSLVLGEPDDNLRNKQILLYISFINQ